MKHFLNSFRYAVSGIFQGARLGRNFRVQGTAAVFVLFLAPFLAQTRGEWCVLFLCIVMVLAGELFNTAIEQVCDAVDRRPNPFIRIVKDTSAGGVLLLSIGSVAVAVIMGGRPQVWTALWSFATTHLWYPALLAADLILCIVFILTGRNRSAQFKTEKE